MDLLVFSLLFFAFLFGAIIGSFLNVLVLRMRTGRSVGGRSACMSCGKALGMGELVPIFSYLIQGGRCRGCKSRVSVQYILVEAVTALAFTLITWKLFFVASPSAQLLTSFALSLFAALVAAILIAIVAYDVKHKIIPDVFVVALFVCALVRLGYLYFLGVDLIPQLGSALLMTLGFWLLWLVSGGRWLGLGDVKLILPLALLLPWNDNLVALVLSFWLGAGVGIFLLILGNSVVGKRYQMKSELPFAPFLILGTAIAYFIHVPLFPF